MCIRDRAKAKRYAKRQVMKCGTYHNTLNCWEINWTCFGLSFDWRRYVAAARTRARVWNKQANSCWVCNCRRLMSPLRLRNTFLWFYYCLRESVRAGVRGTRRWLFLLFQELQWYFKLFGKKKTVIVFCSSLFRNFLTAYVRATPSGIHC